MPVSPLRSSIVGAMGAVLGLVAVASVFWMPDRWQWILYFQASGANELRLPIGYGLATGAWIAGLTVVTHARVLALTPRGILIAAVAHVLVLLAAFAAILPETSAFSSTAYQLYARLFCAVALASSTGWLMHVVKHESRTDAAMAMPVVVGAGTLALLLLRAEPVLASIALAGGLVTAVGRIQERALSALSALRALIADDRVFAAVIFLVALVLRLLYLQRVMSNPGYVETGADGPAYDELAWSIAQGHGVRESFTDRFPLLLLGYVRLVSAIYMIAGHSYFAVGFIQAVVGSATCVLFYSVARELCGVTVARTATWFTTISFPLLFAAAAIGHQAIDVFLTTAIVWLLVKTGRLGTWRWWHLAAIGVLFGIAIAVRETVTFFLAFVMLWILAVHPRRWSWRALGAAATVAGAAFVTIAPLTLPKIESVEQRAKLRHHFDLLYRGEMDPVRMRDDIVAPLENPGAAIAQLRESPGLVLGTLGRAWIANFGLQFFTQPYGGFDLVFLRKGTPYYHALWFYAYALAIGGTVIVVWGLRSDTHAAGLALVLGLIASRTLPHVILESNYRHRVPIEPFLILLASIAMVELVASARRLKLAA
jgi:hypothetical protein